MEAIVSEIHQNYILKFIADSPFKTIKSFWKQNESN